MWPFLGSLIGAGASIFGGMMGQDNASEQYWNNVRRSNRQLSYQKQLNLANMNFAKHWADKNFNFAKSQADLAAERNTMAWKVRDAKRAGVHPLYALGGGNYAASSPPSVVGPSMGVTGGGPVGYSGDGGMASAISQAGQHIGRAVDSMASREQRDAARISTALSLENQGLQNDLLRSQITRINSQVGPALPAPNERWLVDGQGDSNNLIKEGPLKRVVSDPARPFSEPGAITDVGYARTADGGWAPVPSADVKERIEDNLIAEATWAIRNQMLPSLQTGMAPPFTAPHGSAWYYNPITQAYKLQTESGWRGAVEKFGRYVDYFRN